MIPLVSQLILITTKNNSDVETPVKQSKSPVPHHIVAELLDCRNLDSDTILKNVLEDALTTIDPPLHWNPSQITSYGTYAVALLDDLCLSVHLKSDRSLYIDLYSDNCSIDSTYLFSALKQEFAPTRVHHLFVNS